MRALKLCLFFQLMSQSLCAPSYSTDKSEIDEFQLMTFDLGFGKETFNAYVQPNVTTFSRGSLNEATKMNHNGHAVKFFNISPKALKYFWDGGVEHIVFMGTIQPFGVLGTASFPGHQFFFADETYVEGSKNGNGIVRRFTVDGGGDMVTNYYYDPFTIQEDEEATDRNLMQLSLEELEKYNIMKRNMKFSKHYKDATGREYLAMYPRQKPRYFMWPADYYGQEHWFTTKETHFKSIPPADEVKKIANRGKERVLLEDEPRLLAEYRSDEQDQNMTVTVLSCAPRVYEVTNFLSDAEVDHIISLAKAIELKPSSTGQGTDHGSEKKTKTRTSLNTWVGRETDQVIDAIYRRSADFLRIDEALFRDRDADEFPDLRPKGPISEQLQLVHYNVGQEYTAHHDFGYAAAGDKVQGARYATLLFYLNEPEQGGETEFPRWFNGETARGLTTSPKKGKAVLFYSQLPDGNMDDLSHHAALPVREGEKFLINLWVRDPSFGST